MIAFRLHELGDAAADGAVAAAAAVRGTGGALRARWPHTTGLRCRRRRRRLALLECTLGQSQGMAQDVLEHLLRVRVRARVRARVS